MRCAAAVAVVRLIRPAHDCPLKCCPSHRYINATYTGAQDPFAKQGGESVVRILVVLCFWFLVCIESARPELHL